MACAVITRHAPHCARFSGNARAITQMSLPPRHVETLWPYYIRRWTVEIS